MRSENVFHSNQVYLALWRLSGRVLRWVLPPCLPCVPATCRQPPCCSPGRAGTPMWVLHPLGRDGANGASRW